MLLCDKEVRFTFCLVDFLSSGIWKQFHNYKNTFFSRERAQKTNSVALTTVRKIRTAELPLIVAITNRIRNRLATADSKSWSICSCLSLTQHKLIRKVNTWKQARRKETRKPPFRSQTRCHHQRSRQSNGQRAVLLAGSFHREGKAWLWSFKPWFWWLWWLIPCFHSPQYQAKRGVWDLGRHHPSKFFMILPQNEIQHWGGYPYRRHH